MIPPGGVGEVLKALANANYIGILTSALVLGLALKNSKESTK